METVGRYAGRQAPIPPATPLPKTIKPTDHTKAADHLRWELKANLANIVGATAFLYFSAPYGLILGYSLWAIHYVAKIQSKGLTEKSPNSDRAWVILYGFGFITSVACAIFAHGALPITVAIVAVRTAATLLSSTETALLGWKVFTYTASTTEQSFATPRRIIRPVTTKLLSHQGSLGKLATTIAAAAKWSISHIEGTMDLFTADPTNGGAAFGTSSPR